MSDREPFIANPGVDLDHAPAHLRRELEGFNLNPITTPSLLAHARALAGLTPTPRAGAALRAPDESETTMSDRPDTADHPAAAGRAAAADHLGRQVARDHLTPAQRERLSKRLDDLDRDDTAAASTEARSAPQGEQGDAVQAGRAFALDRLTPEQRARVAAILARRDLDRD